MERDEVDDTRLIFTDAAAAGKTLDQAREAILAASPDDVARDIESRLTLADAALQIGSSEFQEFFCSCTQYGLAPGSQGWWDENWMQLRPWGLDLADIAVPVLLMHGWQDMLVSPGHGEWLGAHIPGVEARWFDGYGHGSLAQNCLPEVRAWLSEHRQRPVARHPAESGYGRG